MLGMRELKQLERQIRIGVERIRSKKRRMISEHINWLKRKHKLLKEENIHLQKQMHEPQESGSTGNSNPILLDPEADEIFIYLFIFILLAYVACKLAIIASLQLTFISFLFFFLILYLLFYYSIYNIKGK
nr:truncated transcription factor CAULIFLOWER A-like [Ipomoea batatas]